MNWRDWDLTGCGPNAGPVIELRWRDLDERQSEFACFLYSKGGYPVTTPVESLHTCHYLFPDEWDRYAELRFDEGMGCIEALKELDALWRKPMSNVTYLGLPKGKVA